MNHLTPDDEFILKEMAITRQYCSAILRERVTQGFNSLKYPLISVKVNHYFLPDFADIIAKYCNLIGYMNIPAVEYDEDAVPYEESGKIEVKLDTTQSAWQQEMFEQRDKARKEAVQRKIDAES